MSEKRFSEMTHPELRQEIVALNEKARKAEQMGMLNEFAVYERRVLLAKAYLLDPNDFKSGETYQMKDGESTFSISYMNGHFAWGYRNNEAKLEGVPISLIEQKS